MIKLGVIKCSRGGKLLPAFFFTRFYSLSEGDKEKDGRNQQPFRHDTEASFGCGCGDEEREENLKELTGFPQRFCEAKDLWEKEEQALKLRPDEGGPARVALLRRGDSCTN